MTVQAFADVRVDELVRETMRVYDQTCPGLSRPSRRRREKFEERLRVALQPIVAQHIEAEAT